MKNVKYGFQFGIGFYLAKTLLYLPSAFQDKRVKREFKRLKDAIHKAKNIEPETPKETRSNVFPKCKNKIGFYIE